MKRTIIPFYVLCVLPVSVVFTACSHSSHFSPFQLTEISLWKGAIILLLAAISSISIILHYKYRKMKMTLHREKEAVYLEARTMVEVEKQKAIQQAYKMLEEKKARAIGEANDIIKQAKEEARQLQAQVTTTSVMLANKTDYLLQLQEKLKNSDSTECKRIAKELKGNIAETDHWGDFIKNFNLLHPHYVDNIIKKHPDLTSNEIRLICFILSGLSNKEIAGIFSVEPESVKKARYRLKKKLNLPEEESLSLYLNNLKS
jgi:DNA-binding CsgD family transcriptional regulator